MIYRCFVMLIVNMLPWLIAFSGPAREWGQDLVTVAPDAAKVEYEDARVRVV